MANAMTKTRALLAAILVSLVVPGPLLRAQEREDASVLLEQAIQTELVDGDLQGAITLYADIVDRFGDEREVAARALLHMGRSYDKMGEPKAREAYERVLADYADQDREAAEAEAGISRLVEAEAQPDLGPSEVVVGQGWTRPTPVIPVRAPNGRFLIFSDLAVQDRNTGATRRLSGDTRSAAYPLISPDSRRVAYLSWSENSDLPWNPGRPEGARAVTVNQPISAELRVVNLDGTDERTLLSAEDVRWLRPFEWSPDGNHILAVLERGDSTNEIAMVSVGDGSTQILKSLEYRYPETLGFSSNGREVAFMLPKGSGAAQRDMFVLELAGGVGTPPLERRYTLPPSRQEPDVRDRDIIHVLNRLGYGPRAGDIERVRAMGIEAYIEEQLYPERIPDPVVDGLLSDFTSLAMTSEQMSRLTETFNPVPQLAARARVFEKRRMMDRTGQAGGPVPPLNMQAFREAAGALDPAAETRIARVIRAVYSERQLQEMMVDFWMNHFNINFTSDYGDIAATTLSADFEQNVIRGRTLGRFEDLLMAVAKHPAMLEYLDNRVSSAPAEVIEARIEELKPTLDIPEYLALRERMPFLENARGLNENYARELLELHTVGIDGGYTQEDIIEIAKVLTGWTTTAWTRGDGVTDIGSTGGRFVFDGLLHVEGDKVVMGQTIPSGGVAEGEQLIRMLAVHPSTARFISTKLVRRFVADDPPSAVVDAATRTFLETGGDIREVLRTIFMSPGFRSPSVYGAKVKKPFELIVSSLRAVAATVDEPLERTTEEAAGGPLALLVSFGGNRGRPPAFTARMGERLYNYEAPDGNPDIGAAWINSNALLARLEFANELATDRIPGFTADLNAAEALLGQLGLPRPTPEQIEQTRAMMQASADAEAEAGRPGMQSGGMMARPDGGAAGDGEAEIPVEAVTVATMLGSPQFQTR